MDIIKVSCPGCHHKFNLKTPNPQALISKTFKCPKCGYSTSFSQILGNSEGNGAPRFNALKTTIGGALNAVTGGKTKVFNGGMTAGVGVALRVESTGKQFSLQSGLYILGRDSADSAATIRLAPDPYMSRQHARLSVNNNMGRTSVSLSALKSSNPIFVNNQKLTLGSAISLKPGDKILLGMTTVQLIRV